MPAPKRANTVNATYAARDASRRRRLEEAAAKLRAAGGEVVLPYAWERGGNHIFQIEIQVDGTWTLDRCGDKKNAPWFTLGGAALRQAELDSRGLVNRLHSNGNKIEIKDPRK